MAPRSSRKRRSVVRAATEVAPPAATDLEEVQSTAKLRTPVPPDEVEFTNMETKTKYRMKLTEAEAGRVQLKNGRWAYRVKCPDPGKEGRDVFMWKFCSKPKVPETIDLTGEM